MRPAQLTRHDGVSCDACSKCNFSGDRFKCLICYDFDLCRECYENGMLGNGGDHEADHPVQCIMTGSDFEFFYWGEPASADELRCMSFVCPHCASAGFSLANLYEHVRVEHPRASYEVICPVCVSTPSADPNNMTDDLAAHLASDHINSAAGSGAAGYGAHPSLTASSQRHLRMRGRGRGALLSNGGRSSSSAGSRMAQGRSSAAAADARTSQVAEMLHHLGSSGGRSGNGYLRLLRTSLARREAGRSNATSGGADRSRVNVVSRDGQLIFSDWQQVESLLADASLADAWAEVVAQEQLMGQGQRQVASTQPANQSRLVITSGVPSNAMSGFAATVVQSADSELSSSATHGSRQAVELDVALDTQQSAPAGVPLFQLVEPPGAAAGPPASGAGAGQDGAAATRLAQSVLWPDARFLAPSSSQPSTETSGVDDYDPESARRFLTDLLASTLPQDTENAERSGS